MGLIPITYRWDKYIFGRDTTTATVPKPERPRRVEPGKKVIRPVERQGKPKEDETPEDAFLEGQFFPRGWMRNYRERRTLWKPQHSPAVANHFSKILTMAPPGGKPPQHPLLEALKKQYGCQLQSKLFSKAQTRPMEQALQEVAQGNYDLVVLDRSNLEWTGAILKEISEPVLVVPAQSGEATLPKKILVPVDGTPFSYPALSQAMVLGEDFGAEIQLFAVKEGEDPGLRSLVEKMAWKNLHHDLFQSKGNIPQAIADFAEKQKIHLVLMGTHGVSPGSTHFPPSVTLETLNRLAIPLWVVHPEV